MRICLAIDQHSRRDRLLAEHFGASACFVIYDTQTDTFEPHTCHDVPCRGPCQCHLPALSQQRVFDAVICRSIGARAFAAMRRHQIEVFLTQAHCASEALDGWRSQALRAAAKGACSPAQAQLRARKRPKRNA